MKRDRYFHVVQDLVFSRTFSLVYSNLDKAQLQINIISDKSQAIVINTVDVIPEDFPYAAGIEDVEGMDKWALSPTALSLGIRTVIVDEDY
jgi:hypothetical protein